MVSCNFDVETSAHKQQMSSSSFGVKRTFKKRLVSQGPQFLLQHGGLVTIQTGKGTSQFDQGGFTEHAHTFSIHHSFRKQGLSNVFITIQPQDNIEVIKIRTFHFFSFNGNPCVSCDGLNCHTCWKH